ncbi:hypothetical protein BD779DRAFT_1443711, partial [Infundibulicybe gibba]
KAISLIIKDVSWLWRTAYNYAAQGCSELLLARDLLESFCQTSPVGVGSERYICLINASFLRRLRPVAIISLICLVKRLPPVISCVDWNHSCAKIALFRVQNVYFRTRLLYQMGPAIRN